MKLLTLLRPSPAMVVACIALAVALGGTSYAAISLPRNSVGTKQLKKNAVTSAKVKANAITSPKVAGNSLTGADIKETTLGTVPSATTAAPSGPAGGAIAGTYPNPMIAADAIGSASVLDAAAPAGLRKADIAAVSTVAIFDPPGMLAQTCSYDQVPVPGAQTGDIIIAHPVGTVWQGLIWAPWVVTGNLVYMRFCNPTAAVVDGPPLPTYVLLIR